MSSSEMNEERRKVSTLVGFTDFGGYLFGQCAIVMPLLVCEAAQCWLLSSFERIPPAFGFSPDVVDEYVD